MIEYGGERHKYPPAGKCIYCGTTEGKLSDEHIVPFSLNGNWILPKSSCVECAKKTQKIEEVCTHERYGMFHPLRTRLKMQSRRGKARHAQLPVLVAKPDGTREVVTMPSDGFPAIAFGMYLPPAGILLGNEPSNSVHVDLLFRVMVPPTASADIARKLQEGAGVRLGCLNITAFFQLLAKIGHAYAAAELGSETLHPMLPDIILGKSDTSPFLVGGDAIPFEGKTTTCFHRLELVETTILGQRFTLSVISLFGQLGLPRYQVVVRQRPAVPSDNHPSA